MYPRIKEVYIQNYKSIEKARVKLEPFTILVGANGTGKSNFLSALQFIAGCTNGPLYTHPIPHKMRDEDLRFRKSSSTVPLSFRIDVQLDMSTYAFLAFEIEEFTAYSMKVKREKCSIYSEQGIKNDYEFLNGEIHSNIDIFKRTASGDNLILNAAAASDIPGFLELHKFLNSMRLYSIDPRRLKGKVKMSHNQVLESDGSNAAAVFAGLAKQPNGKMKRKRIESLLSGISAGTKEISWMGMSIRNEEDDRKFYDNDNFEAEFHFFQDFGDEHVEILEAKSMSDGTLSALGCLIAAYQPGYHSVVAIEEPEATIHPGASEVMVHAFNDAAHDRQIIISTHSADILDIKDVKADQIRVFELKDGRTQISEVSESGKGIIRDQLYTAGELMRMDELHGHCENDDFDIYADAMPTSGVKP